MSEPVAAVETEIGPVKTRNYRFLLANTRSLHRRHWRSATTRLYPSFVFCDRMSLLLFCLYLRFLLLLLMAVDVAFSLSQATAAASGIAGIPSFSYAQCLDQRIH